MSAGEPEFDQYAETYDGLHRTNIVLSGEEPAYFAEYKIRDLREVLKECSLPMSGKVLDFGAGTGSSVPFLRQYLPEMDITCLDVSEKSLAVSEERLMGMATFVNYDGANIPFPDETFDVVFAACVFHHIPHELHEAILNDIKRVLKRGGIMMIYEHNPFNPLTVRAVNTCPFDENAHLLHPYRLKKLGERQAFTRTICRFRVFFPSLLKMLRPLEGVLTWLPLGAQYYVVGQK